MKIHRFPLLALMMVCLLALAVSKTSQAQQDVIEKAKQEGEVIIWTMSFDNAEDFLKGFYKKHPYLKVKIWDGRTEEVVNHTSFSRRTRSPWFSCNFITTCPWQGSFR